MKVFNAFIKLFEAPQRSVKIKIFHFFRDWDVKGYALNASIVSLSKFNIASIYSIVTDVSLHSRSSVYCLRLETSMKNH